MRYVWLALVQPLLGNEVPPVAPVSFRGPVLRREPGRRKHKRPTGGLLDVTIDSEGNQHQDDDVCEGICRAIDVTTVSKKCVDLSNEECASASFYETLDNGDRRPCALKPAAMSLSDPNAENCEVDSKRTCKKGKALCAEGTPDSGAAETKAAQATASSDEAEDCNFCDGRGDFLPSATAFMEDGLPYTCQYASERIRSGELRMSCLEAAMQLVDCCSGTLAEAAQAVPEAGEADCELCQGIGSLNGSEIAMIIAGEDPMSCFDAEENLKKGLAPISCDAARKSELVTRCCVPIESTPENCSLCSEGEEADESMELDGSLTCGEVAEQLENQQRSCNDMSLARFRSQCCRCDLCDGRNFLPDAIVAGDLRCGDATLRQGNSSIPCAEAKQRWATVCCGSGEGAAAGPTSTSQLAAVSAASEAEAHGEEATPFCKSLCLKTDVVEWNMTCEDLPKEDCTSTHFFQTVSNCERRLCVWDAPWTCSLDSTQACLSCNWPCGRKATTSTTTTSTTSTTSTTTTTTTSTTTTFTTTILGALSRGASNAAASGTGDTGDTGADASSGYYVHGEEVPNGCFDFCARTDVRSMSLTCSQLSSSQCDSGNFYQTDVAGNRRYCRLFDECMVDDSFVCNASMPICRVPEADVAEATDDVQSNSTEALPLPASTSSLVEVEDEDVVSATTTPPTERGSEALLESVEAAARECLASGASAKEIWQIFQASTASSSSWAFASPADRALKKALAAAQLFGLGKARLAEALHQAGVPELSGDDSDGAFCDSLCSKYQVANCSTLSVEFCRSRNFYQRSEAGSFTSGLSGRRCDLGEDGCTSSAAFFCKRSCVDGNLSNADRDVIGPEAFCRSLCSKTKVLNCSHLSSDACQSQEYYVEHPPGFVLCQGDSLGRCIPSVAAAVSSCQNLSQLCGAAAPGPPSSTAAPRSSTTESEVETAEIPLFGTSCSESCPEVSADLCDGDWKQTGQCSCHCRKYRPHIVMLLVNSLGFNDFVDSTDLSVGWPFLKSVLPKAIRINSSYVEPGSAPSRTAFLTGRWPRHLTWASAPSLPSADAASGAQGWSPLGVSRHRQLGSTVGAFAQAGEHTIAEKLNDAGYKSYAIGKWQAGGVSWKMTPGGRGFSRFFGSYDDASDYVKHCDMQGHYDLHYEETEQFEANGSWRFHRPYHYYPSGKDVVGRHVNSLFQDKAKQFIQDHQAKYGRKGVPMFLYYAPMSFQEPLQAPQWTAGNCSIEQGFGSAGNSNRQTFCRMATSLDRSIQEIAKTVQGAFLEDNWLMVVVSDSGGSASHKGSGGSNWPLRGSRGEVWEGGIRTKALIFGSHPELEAAKTRSQTYSAGFLHLVDWHATLLRVAHATPASLAAPNDMNGVSVWRELLDDLPSPRREFIANGTGISGEGGGLCIRSGDYKLIMAPSGGKNPVTGEKQGFRWPVRVVGNAEYLSLYDVDPVGSRWTKGADWKLFNIRADPTESSDLSEVFPDEVKRLEDRLAEFMEGRSTVGDSLLRVPPCPGCETLTDISNKALQVLRSHSGEIEGNECPIQEAAYPFWEEAIELADVTKGT